MLVSILINNYNYSQFLRDAIDSALNQTYPSIEVIVVDDGSTDSSRDIIVGYGDRIIPVLKGNGGQASAFNAGFAASRGEWICLLDSDDIFLPRKVEEIVRLSEENPSVGFVAHNLDYCDGDGVPSDFLPPLIREAMLVDDQVRVRRGRVTVSLPATSGLCLRRGTLKHILPMPEDIRVTADNYVKTAALSLTPALLVREPLGRQRIHDRNLFTTKCAETNESALLCRILISAQVGFYLKQRHPFLAKLAWKQYGWMLYQLSSLRSPEAQAVKAEVRLRYSVVDRSLASFFYVGGVFTKALIRDLLGGVV